MGGRSAQKMAFFVEVYAIVLGKRERKGGANAMSTRNALQVSLSFPRQQQGDPCLLLRLRRDEQLVRLWRPFCSLAPVPWCSSLGRRRDLFSAFNGVLPAPRFRPVPRPSRPRQGLGLGVTGHDIAW